MASGMTYKAKHAKHAQTKETCIAKVEACLKSPCHSTGGRIKSDTILPRFMHHLLCLGEVIVGGIQIDVK
jgi:hypothetical protein